MSAPWNWVKDAFEWIGKAIKNIAKKIIDIVKSICETLWQWVKDVFNGIIETIKDVGLFIYHTVTFEISKAFKDLYNTLGDVVSIVGCTFDAIFKILDELTFGLFSKVWGVLQKIISIIMICVCIATGQVELALAMITTSLLAATGAIEDPVIFLAIAVTLTIVAGQAPIRRQLLALRQEIGEFINVDLDTLTWALSEGYIGWTDILGNELSGVVAKIGEILDMTKEEIWGLLNNIATGIGGTVGKVYDALKEGVDFVANTVRPVWGFIKQMAEWTYDKIYKAARYIVKTAKESWGWAVNNIGDVVLTIGNWIVEKGKWLYEFVRNRVFDFWEIVKKAAIGSWEYISKVVKPVVNWVKTTIWPTITSISNTLIEVSQWINQKGKEIYAWYAAHIKPYTDRIVDLIHKAAVITEVIRAIKEGKVVRALLTGIGILGGKIEDVSRNILKYYDGTLTSIMKGIGYGIGWVRKMITDLYTSANRIAKDVGKMGINVGWKVLNDMSRFISDVAKATLGKVYIKIGDVDRTVREWIAYLKEPVTRALSIIYQTHAEFHKYDYAYRAAYLRQLSTVTGRPFHYLFLPKVLYSKP